MTNEEHFFSQVPNNLAEVTKGDYQNLQLAASQFINKVEQMIYDMNHVYNMIKSKSSLATGLTQFYQLMRNDTKFTQDALVLQHEFEVRLNDFLGRTIYLTWVDENGHLIYLDDVHIKEVYEMATANRGRGNIAASKMKNFADTNDLQKELRTQLQRSEDLRRDVYFNATERWEGNNTQIKSRRKRYKDSYQTFYWRTHDPSHISGHTDRIATKGVIAEGYVNAVINEDDDVVSSKLEESLKNLWFNYIKGKKDSVAAAIKGDIIVDNDANIHLAVKEGSFSTAKFGQYLALAYNIQQIPSLTVEDFQVLLPELLKRSSKKVQSLLERLGEDKAEDNFNSLIEDIFKKS